MAESSPCRYPTHILSHNHFPHLYTSIYYLGPNRPQKIARHMKCHVKARNLMSVASCECVVGGNTPGTTYLTSAAQTSHTPPPRMQSYELRNARLISCVNTVWWWSWWCSLPCRLCRSITWSQQGANARIDGISCPVEGCRFMLARHCHGEYTITNSLLTETFKKNIKICSQSSPNPLSNPYFQSSPILYLLSPQLFTNP